jgi:hypothetical protein
VIGNKEFHRAFDPIQPRKVVLLPVSFSHN